MTSNYSNNCHALERYGVAIRCPILDPKLAVEAPCSCALYDILAIHTAKQHNAWKHSRKTSLLNCLAVWYTIYRLQGDNRKATGWECWGGVKFFSPQFCTLLSLEFALTSGFACWSIYLLPFLLVNCSSPFPSWYSLWYLLLSLFHFVVTKLSANVV